LFGQTGQTIINGKEIILGKNEGIVKISLTSGNPLEALEGLKSWRGILIRVWRVHAGWQKNEILIFPQVQHGKRRTVL